jgi:molybdenum cofactor synthesis domain-containing protein
MELPLKAISVNISVKKGTVKLPAETIEVYEEGVRGDAHSGPWNRMISLLGRESIARFEAQAGRTIKPGEFAENITTEGVDLVNTRPLDIIEFGDVLLEVTQLGKKCHGDNCAIFREVGNCVMPKEGIFCRVLRPGLIKAGDAGTYRPKVFNCAVITLSDRAYQGVYEDQSGPLLEQRLREYFKSQERHCEVQRVIIPDDAELLHQTIMEMRERNDFIFTTGGTGIGPRDITPDVVKSLLDKEIPGIMEMIRVKYGMQKPNALLSRGVAGLSNRCFIFTLPGSVKAVNEYMDEISAGMMHLVYMLHSLDMH